MNNFERSVMDYTDLSRDSMTRQDKSKPVPHVICCLGSLFRALAHAARHIVMHRDIKPTIVRESPESSEAILIDWGGSILYITDLSTGAPALISPDSRVHTVL